MAMDIRTTPAILAYKTRPSSHSIEQPKAEWKGSFSLSKVNVEMTLPRVSIDQEAAFNESGLKNNEAFLQDSVAFALQKMSEGVGRRASQGDQLAKIHEGGDAIAMQAPQNAYDQFLHDFNMVTMPTSGAQIDLIEGQVDITVTDGAIEGGYEAKAPIIDYRAGKIERYMDQYQSITMKYLGETLDLSV